MWRQPNRRQRLFAESFVAHGDATKAYCEVYDYPEATGRVRNEIGKRAQLLLDRPPMRALVAALRTGQPAPVESQPRRPVRERPSTAYAFEAATALEELSFRDIAMLGDPVLGRLEAVLRAQHSVVVAEIDARRGLLPRTIMTAHEPLPAEPSLDAASIAGTPTRRPPTKRNGTVCVREHAAALLARLQELAPAGRVLDAEAVRGTYMLLLHERAWPPAPWPRVARALIAMTGSRKRYASTEHGNRVSIYDIPPPAAH